MGRLIEGGLFVRHEAFIGDRGLPVGSAIAANRMDITAIGIDVAEIKERHTNNNETDLVIPDFPSMGSAKPARLAIIPANAEKNVIAIN